MKRNVFDPEVVTPNFLAIGSIFQNNPLANSRNELYFIILTIAGLIHHPHVVHARSVATETGPPHFSRICRKRRVPSE